jgi:RNA methyltransferase, TrmH family
MISKRRHKELSALQIKKFRTEHQLFLVEGEKIVDELLHSEYKIQSLIATADWIATHKQASPKSLELLEASPDELKKISSLKTPNQVVAVVKVPETVFEISRLKEKLALVLDGVQDPGNMGTIIRLCDWFGINQLICSESTVDAYNPKVVQASMGSIFRVKIEYGDLTLWLDNYRKSFSYPVFGAFLDGDNIYSQSLSSHGLIIMGNESKGISTEIQKYISQKLYIPRADSSAAESLNVSVAAAIICSEFRRRKG